MEDDDDNAYNEKHCTQKKIINAYTKWKTPCKN